MSKFSRIKKPYADGSPLDLTFLPEIYASTENDGGTVYRVTHDSVTDAVSSSEDFTFVATYRLVKVEKLKLKRTVEVVKA